MTIVGVMLQTFDVPAKIDLWSAAQFEADRFGAYRGEGTHFFNMVARIRPDVTPEHARGDLERIGSLRSTSSSPVGQ